MIRRPPSTTRTDTLFPYTTLFRSLEVAWQFDVPAYLASGNYVEELREAAAEIGLQMFEKDGRIYCFPLIARINAKDAAVRIGKSLERRDRKSTRLNSSH